MPHGALAEQKSACGTLGRGWGDTLRGGEVAGITFKGTKWGSLRTFVVKRTEGQTNTF